MVDCAFCLRKSGPIKLNEPGAKKIHKLKAKRRLAHLHVALLPVIAF